MPRRRIIINVGDRFGKLTATGTVKKGKVLFNCDCGGSIMEYPSRVGVKRNSCGCDKWYNNLLNTRIGMLYITDIIQREPITNRITILTKCDCGTQRYMRTSVLRGTQQSCGCLRHAKKPGGKTLNREGMVIGKLTVLSEHRVEGEDAIWKVHCECGTEKWVNVAKVLYHFKQLGAASCGCSRIKYELPAARLRWQAYKSGAKKRKIDFDLSFDDFMLITAQVCSYCGSEPHHKKISRRKHLQGIDFIYTGIDRVDSSKGYTKDNCVPCCLTCNRAKNDMNVTEFYKWVRRVHDYQLL